MAEERAAQLWTWPFLSRDIIGAFRKCFLMHKDGKTYFNGGTFRFSAGLRPLSNAFRA